MSPKIIECEKPDPRTNKPGPWCIPFSVVSAWTLAEALKSLGYETAAWVANPWINNPQWGFDQGFDHFFDSHRKHADQMIREIREWLEMRSAELGGDRPMFLFIHFMDVHGPPNSSRGEVEEKMTSILADRIQRLQEGPTLLKTQTEIDPQTLKKLRSLGYVQ